MGAPSSRRSESRSFGNIIETQKDVTPAVLAAMAQTPDDRLREIAAAFIRHIHAFAREVKLTEDEYDVGIDFLNRIGQATSDRHNEGILFADAIGLSTLVCLLNNGNAGATETTSALLGPFWRMNSPRDRERRLDRSFADARAGAVRHRARCIDAAGKPIEGVEVDVWQSSPDRALRKPGSDTQADMNLRGKFTTDAQGRFSFRSVKPAGYPVPTDGPVGDMLRAQSRHPYRPAHIHFLGFKPGFKTLITQVFVDDDQHLGSDVVFGVTRALIGDYRRHDFGAPPAPDIKAPWYTLDYTLRDGSGRGQASRAADQVS